MNSLLSDEEYRTIFGPVGRRADGVIDRLLKAAAIAAGLPARWRSTPTNYAEDNHVVELTGEGTTKLSGVPPAGWNRLPCLESWTNQLREQGIRLGLLARGDKWDEYFGIWRPLTRA